jgi:hypothetical protein
MDIGMELMLAVSLAERTVGSLGLKWAELTVYRLEKWLVEMMAEMKG